VPLGAFAGLISAGSGARLTCTARGSGRFLFLDPLLPRGPRSVGSGVPCGSCDRFLVDPAPWPPLTAQFQGTPVRIQKPIADQTRHPVPGSIGNERLDLYSTIVGLELSSDAPPDGPFSTPSQCLAWIKVLTRQRLTHISHSWQKSDEVCLKLEVASCELVSRDSVVSLIRFSFCVRVFLSPRQFRRTPLD
jgi:hypothetical protein